MESKIEYKTKKETEKESGTVSVKATENFKGRRLITIDGLETKEYRALQAGQIVVISITLFNKYPDLFEKCGA